MSMLEIHEALARGALTLTRLTDGTGVLLDVSGCQVLTLNETGLVLVEALQEGLVSETELMARLQAGFEVDEQLALSDIRAFVEELNGLLAA